MENYKNCVVIIGNNGLKFIKESNSYEEYIGVEPKKLHFINNIYILYNEKATGDINLYVEGEIKLYGKGPYVLGESNLTKIRGNAVIVNIENNIIKSLEEEQITYLNEVIEDGKIQQLFREYYKSGYGYEVLENPNATILSKKVKEKNLMRAIHYNSTVNKFYPVLIKRGYESITKYVEAPIDYINLSSTVDCIVYDSFLELEEEFSNIIRLDDENITVTKGNVLIVGYDDSDGYTISLKYTDFLNFYNHLIKSKFPLIGTVRIQSKDSEGNVEIKKLKLPVITNDFNIINK